MPLKKPKSVPDIPKTRKKTTEKLKEAVPAKKSDEIEYHCKFYFYYNPSKKTQQYAVELETTRLFSVLNYQLSLNSRKAKNIIDISVLGLKATNSYTNEPGPASGVLYFDELYGKHTINIIKQDGSINSAILNFNIFKKSIDILDESVPEKKNNSKFCTFGIAEKKFSFA
jgi:hypothetical protein